MRIASVTRSPGGDDPQFVRITAQVRMASGDAFDIWFEVPAWLEGDLAESGNPWLLAALPHALPHGEEIASELPVDGELMENLQGLVSVWQTWYPALRRPTITCPTLAPAAERRGATAAFFSGGIDSWFTTLRHLPEREPAAIGRVDELITVHGFDIPVENGVEFAKLRATLADAAAAIARPLIVVRTNLRRKDTLWAKGWGWLTHGAGLAAAALILEKRYGKVLVGSTHPYGALIPWGSHPITDPLLSTSSLTVKHDGASFQRVEKTALVARHPEALRHLHVCWKHAAASNCGTCAKCLRTMSTLHLLGIPPPAGVFAAPLDLRRLARILIEDENENEFFREVRALASRTGNAETEHAIARAMLRSSRIRPLFATAERLRSVPGMWRIEHAIRRLWAGAG